VRLVHKPLDIDDFLRVVGESLLFRPAANG